MELKRRSNPKKRILDGSGAHPPCMAGYGFMERSSNCLIINKFDQYQALFLVKYQQYTNVFGLKNENFEFLFTHDSLESQDDIKTKQSIFMTTTVISESQILLTTPNRDYFGLSINIKAKRIKFTKEKNIYSNNQLKKITFFKHLNLKSIIGALVNLSLAIQEKTNLHLVENRSRWLRTVFSFRCTDLLNKQIISASMKKDLKSKEKGIMSNRVSTVVVTGQYLILGYKFDARAKKILKIRKIKISGFNLVPKLNNSKPVMFLPGPVYNPWNDSLLLNMRTLSARKLLASVRLFEANKELVKSWKTSYFTSLIEIFPGQGLMIKPVSGQHALSYNSCKIVDDEKINLQTLSNLWPDLEELEESIRIEQDLSNPKIQFDLLGGRGSEGTLILRTSLDIFLHSLQKNSSEINSTNEAPFKVTLVDKFTHCYRTSLSDQLTEDKGLILMMRKRDTIFDLFKSTQEGIRHLRRVSGTSDLKIMKETRQYFFEPKYIKELVSGEIVLIISLVDLKHYIVCERKFALIKLSAKMEILNFEILKIMGHFSNQQKMTSLELEVEELGAERCVGYLMDNTHFMMFGVDFNHLEEVSLSGKFLRKSSPFLIFVKNGKFMTSNSKDNSGLFEESCKNFDSIIFTIGREARSNGFRIVKEKFVSEE